jgi:hypothetical protein
MNKALGRMGLGNVKSFIALDLSVIFCKCDNQQFNMFFIFGNPLRPKPYE